jgi:DNA-binding winged helix-turn-helix (wHTH) protein
MKLRLVEAADQKQPRIRDDSAAIERSPARAADSTVIEFGGFRVLLRQRQLLAGRVPVELGSRAFDVLIVLIEADGSLVTKDELVRRAWPGIVVAPENLKVQICALRNALGEDRDLIRTEFGRGYRFTAAVHRSIATEPDVIEPPARRETSLRMELAAIATQLTDLEGKLAKAVQMLNGTSQPDFARFRRQSYCADSRGRQIRPKHARQGRRGW